MSVFAQVEVIRVDTIHNTTMAPVLIKEQPQFGYLIKFKPLATILGIAAGMFDLELDVVPYVAPKIGIPIEIQLAAGGGLYGLALLSGIEAVPLSHREKSGLFLDLLVGGMYVSTGDLGFCTTAHVGYQLVSRKGFVLNPAIGIKYDTIVNKLGFHLKIDIGFAIKKAKQ
jgi:hypothetical protein